MSDHSIEPEEKIETVFVAEAEVSSEEAPMEEWSSLIIKMTELNFKKIKYDEGLYHPGSGEVCAKYVAVSDSDVFKHPYYNYPAVVDPGIEKALLLLEEKYIYPDDGQELYLKICDEMDEAPVKSFARYLLNEYIDLRYYCISSKGVRAMALALRYNRNVRIFNLKGNFLNADACYHLGDMLSSNCTLVELNLSGCKIGPTGAKRLFNGLMLNRSLRVLNLDRNELTDLGMEYLAAAVFRGIDVQDISLSYNNISGKGVNVLADAFETYNKFTKINLSWNKLFSPGGVYNLLSRLSENKVLSDLNLSWNSMSGARVGSAINKVLNSPNLRYLNLSNNKLSDEGIYSFLPGLNKAKKLVTLDLSYNPMTVEDAKKVLDTVKAINVKVQKVLMDNVYVDTEFLANLNSLKEINLKQNLTITYGAVIGSFKAVGQDMREVLLNRAEFLAKKPKKRSVDIALVAMQLLKDKKEVMPTKEFCIAMQRTGAPLDNDLLEEIAAVFAGPRLATTKTIDINLLVDYMKRKWPERKLPPTPPPEPETDPVSPEKAPAKEKGKKK